ncbi:hypothetical protein [uncultured Tessaracoccus sp.]|uniref:hypothetical protein n=1 Tax=uncultured Tessaracoccus sp. TaxID=905023 RepID=UPI002616AEE6|nr:hypothetical protein [uncultured Tessaracoccus sp.]
MSIQKLEVILTDRDIQSDTPSMSQSVGNCAACTGSAGSIACVSCGGSGKTKSTMINNIRTSEDKIEQLLRQFEADLTAT